MSKNNFQIDLNRNYTIPGRTLAKLQQLSRNSKYYLDEITINQDAASIKLFDYVDSALLNIQTIISQIAFDGS